jgi:hypothetical protein
MNLFQRLYYRVIGTRNTEKVEAVESSQPLVDVPKEAERASTKPAGRVSKPEYREDSLLGDSYCKPEFIMELIPKLRNLSRSNEDLGSVYNDLIQLTNTGHSIEFDQSISEEQVDRMRKHLLNRRKLWGSAVHGIDGLINKWVGQVWIGGALSNEWVIANDMSGIMNSCLVNPENIRFKYDNKTTKYNPYQLITNNRIFDKINPLENSVKLNTNTYFYAGVLGDTDSPYGIPPFITAIQSLRTQTTMKKNIDHILKQLGLLGYLEIIVDKPQMLPNENMRAYEQRLDNFLLECKKTASEGFSEGIVVGYEGEHEFEFHATTKNLAGVGEIFNQNQVQVANGLKTSPTFIGQKSNGTESNLGIIFTKMIAQLKNVQFLVAANLEMGYLLELRLAGFNIKSEQIHVKFKPSTVSDELKLWQSQEIKQRVLKALRVDNIISQDAYAEGMGYDKPNGNEPLVPYKDQAGTAKKDPNESDKETKNKSAKKSRDKDKKQPKRKDTKTS